MKRVFGLYLIFLVSFSGMYAQPSNELLKEYFEEGNFFLERGDFGDAVFYFQKLVDADTSNANYQFKLGESYLNWEGKGYLAIPYLEKAVTSVVSKRQYKKRAFSENAAPLHAWFYLGQAYRMNNELDKALTCYARFKESPDFYGEYNENVVDEEIASCKQARIIQNAPVEWVKTRLSDAVNTSFSEINPVLSADGNTLVFTRKLKFYDAIYCSRKVNGVWQEAVNINAQVLSDGEFYPTGLNDNGTALLLIRDDNGDKNIYLANFEGNQWSPATDIGSPVNTKADEVFASFAANNSTLVITSNRIGGEGGYDIWFSRRESYNGWGRPVNAGNTINTEQNENTGIYCADQQVLFFSSQGHFNMGGYDIFYSKRNGQKWNIPVNLGYPLNDTRNNLGYAPDFTNCRKAFYSLTVDGDEDLYLIEITSESTLNFEAQ